MSLALQEEVAALTGDLKSDATISINAASTEFVSLYLCKTPYKEATLTLRFPDDYPISACFVALESHSLPLKLVKRLTKVLEQEAERAKGGPQIARVVKLLSSVIASNYLIACGQEIRRIREMLAPAPLASGSAPSTSSSTSSSTAPPVPPASGGAKRGGKGKAPLSAGCTMRCGESSGVIRFTLMQPDGLYGVQFKVTVPDGYPAVQLGLEFGWSNFPTELVDVVKPQAENVAIAMAAGRKPPHVRRREREEGAARAVADDIVVAEHYTTTAMLHNVRGDLQYLKKAKDLRKFGRTKKKGDNRSFAHGTKERKNVRKTLRKMTAAETEKERLIVAAEEAEIAERKAAAFALSIGETGSPIPSLVETVRFIWEALVIGVPRIRCPGCDERVFHPDPAESKKLLATKAKKGKEGSSSMRPTNITIFCWWHHACLDVALRQPPFGREGCGCGNCDPSVPLAHPFWTSDSRKLEKGWDMMQAKKREIAEMSGMLGLETFDVGEEEAQKNADAAW